MQVDLLLSIKAYMGQDKTSVLINAEQYDQALTVAHTKKNS